MKLTVAFFLVSLPAFALPGPQWAQVDPAVHDWILNLHSKGSGYHCCDITDGEFTQRDIRMGADGSVHWFVYIDEKWREVPDDAIVVEPNLLGHPIVWPSRYGGDVHINCSLPGALG